MKTPPAARRQRGRSRPAGRLPAGTRRAARKDRYKLPDGCLFSGRSANPLRRVASCRAQPVGTTDRVRQRDEATAAACRRVPSDRHRANDRAVPREEDFNACSPACSVCGGNRRQPVADRGDGDRVRFQLHRPGFHGGPEPDDGGRRRVSPGAAGRAVDRQVQHRSERLLRRLPALPGPESRADLPGAEAAAFARCGVDELR